MTHITQNFHKIKTAVDNVIARKSQQNIKIEKLREQTETGYAECISLHEHYIQASLNLLASLSNLLSTLVHNNPTMKWKGQALTEIQQKWIQTERDIGEQEVALSTQQTALKSYTMKHSGGELSSSNAKSGNTEMHKYLLSLKDFEAKTLAPKLQDLEEKTAGTLIKIFDLVSKHGHTILANSQLSAHDIFKFIAEHQFLESKLNSANTTTSLIQEPFLKSPEMHSRSASKDKKSLMM